MNIHSLDRKIVIESQTDTQNALGEWSSSWATYHTCFAAVSRFGGAEKLEGGKTTATNKIRFKIRFFAGISEEMRVLYNGRYYDIIEIQELHREGLWLTATTKI